MRFPNTTNRIDLLFNRLRRDGKKALIPFVTAGDPDLAATRDLVLTLDQSGAHIIELGVPFSEPLADGPVIQAASLRALNQGVDLGTVFELVEDIRRDSDCPLVLMTYYNPVFQRGLEKAARQAALAGVDGFIIPDLPPEESGAWLEAARASNLDVIFLVAPNTPPSRARFVAGKTTGFLYGVSVTGITGKRAGIPQGLRDYLKMLREITKKPIAVGFGISSPSQVKAIGALCDGVIVGSALVDLVARYGGREDCLLRIRSLMTSLSEALSGKEV